MSESPFPQTGERLGGVATAIDIPERGNIIPAFYVRNPHQDPAHTTVTQNNVPLLGADKKPFVVAQVAEERRWAIHENGEVREKSEFRDMLAQIRLDWYALRNAKYDGNVMLEHTPEVGAFVKWTVDPHDPSNLLMIGFDEHATDGAKPEHYVDGEGDPIAEPRLDMLCRAYADLRLRKKLTPGEIKEVEAYLEVDADAGRDGVAAKIELLTTMHDDGDITDVDYMKRISELAGAKAPESVVEPPEMPFKAACGHACKTRAGVKAHERHCDECSEGDTT